MIRFHLVIPGQVLDQNKYLVEARRKPRGYVIRAKENVRVVEGDGRLYQRVSWRVVDGWRPVGFNGHRGTVHATRRAAALELLSDHKFRSVCSHCGVEIHGTDRHVETWPGAPTKCVIITSLR